MANYPESFDHMMAAWNETDPTKVRELLQKSLSPEVRFVDPSIDLTGIDSFAENVFNVQKRIPGAVYAQASDVDSHHNFYRYHWTIHHNGKLLVSGFDTVQTDESGRVVLVIGFFGELNINR